MAEEGDANGDIADRDRRLAPQFVDDYHIGLGDEQCVVEEHEPYQPAPTVKTSGREQSGEGRHQHAGHRDGLDEAEIVIAAHDGGDGVEDPGQGIDVAVSVDLEHRCVKVVRAVSP